MKAEWTARLVLFLLLASAAGFIGFAAAPALGLVSGDTLEIHARMPENGGWSSETIHATAGQPIHLRLTSDDVLHSFAIGQADGDPTPPAPLELKPGEWHETTLVFDKPGRYTFYCTRWCGRNHWRMRGTIIVDPAANSDTAPQAQPTFEKPLYLQLGLDVDAPHNAAVVPSGPTSAERGAKLAQAKLTGLPAWALDRQTYLTTAPADIFTRLRAEASLKDLSDAEVWDVVAYLQARQTTPAKLAEAKQLYSTNCAACHGEAGKGDGVMVEGLPRFDPSQIHPDGASTASAHPDASGMTGSDAAMTGEMNLSAPPDFSDPHVLLGASPALLQGKLLRGGMGTGMPYWGPIFTTDQLDAIIAYLYTFAQSNHP